jgi:predicted nucleic acid-binding protein
MKEFVIDTNALLSYLTDRAPEQQERISRLFQEAVRMKVLILCPQNVITELVYVLDSVYKLSKDRISAILIDLIALPGLKIVHDVDFNLLLSYWPHRIRDYGDALIAAVCSSHRGSHVATFDRKLKSGLRSVGLSVATI